MKNKLLFFVLNILYSIFGWLLCIVQIGSSMIANYNQSLTLINKKNPEKTKNHKKRLLIGCAIITLPYFLVTLLWIVGWL